MRTMIVCLALATIVALVSAGKHECNEKMIGFVCGKDVEAHLQKKIDAMTPECQTKAGELKTTMKTKHEEMCKTKDDVTKTCETMKGMFKESKAHMGECWPKKME